MDYSFHKWWTMGFSKYHSYKLWVNKTLDFHSFSFWTPPEISFKFGLSQHFSYFLIKPVTRPSHEAKNPYQIIFYSICLCPTVAITKRCAKNKLINKSLLFWVHLAIASIRGCQENPGCYRYCQIFINVLKLQKI